jgi:type II restriction/modification system DNA methylase subunit YeeA
VERIQSLKGKKNELPKFHQKLSTLNFLDPACGCGNFLVITYRELRILELDVLREIYKNQMVTDVESVIWINVDQFYGIEYEEFPARIAEVAMWLIDHQMNMLISYEFGQYFARLPLKKAAKIVHGDAMETDWEEVVPKDRLTHIIGNPPFIGSKIMTQKQRDQIVKEFGTTGGVVSWIM